MEVSVVIPCYKSPISLEQEIRELSEQLSKFKSFEILLICDDCPSNSWELIQKIAKLNKNVKGYLLGQNVGQEATFFGIKEASGKLVVTMDDDGQHPINEIQRLIDILQKRKLDVIYALPERPNHAKYRVAASKLFRSILKILGMRSDANKISSYRIIRGTFIRNFAARNSFQSDIDWILSNYSSRVASYGVKMNQRLDGKSSYTILKLFKHAYQISWSSSESIITKALVFGLLSLLSSIVFVFVTLANYMTGNIKVPGFTTIILFQSLSFTSTIFLLSVVGKHTYQSTRSQIAFEEAWI